MVIVVKCPNPACGKGFNLKPEFAGRTVKCDACKTTIHVPDVPASENAAPTISDKMTVKEAAASRQEPGAAPSRDPLTGRRLGHYLVKDRIGEGGMATVYRARDLRLDKTVALKVLSATVAGRQEFSERLLREARAAARIEHANVLPIYFVGCEEERLFIAMQYVDGGTLAARLHTEGRLNPREAARIAREVALALNAAHGRNIIHRDIKPSNIMLARDGRILVADFGLATFDESCASLTAVGHAVGTPAYMSPEQCTGKDVDHRSDLYSLGVTLFEMVTGQVPYKGANPVHLMMLQSTAPVPDPTHVVPRLSQDLCAIVRRLMNKQRDQRYASAAGLVRDLNAFLGLPRNAGLESAPDLPKHVKTHRSNVDLDLEEQESDVKKAPVAAPVKVSPRRARRPFPIRRALAVAAVLLLIGFAAYWRTNRSYVTKSATGEKIASPLAKNGIAATVDGRQAEAPEGMVYVPPGEFTMGHGDSPPNGPVHTVGLDGYFISKYEVTNAEWRVYVRSGGVAPPPYWPGGKVPPGRENHPVVAVSWEDAQKYCIWMSAETGRSVRLPTEAQWEKAARGTQRLAYPWGDKWNPKACNWRGATAAKFGLGLNNDGEIPMWDVFLHSPRGAQVYGAGGNTAPVGSFPADKSPYGCYDMAGNVQEWCADWWKMDYYRTSQTKNPEGPAEPEADVETLSGRRAKARVQRGGCWDAPAERLRTFFRLRDIPIPSDFTGFRVVCIPERPPVSAR